MNPRIVFLAIALLVAVALPVACLLAGCYAAPAATMAAQYGAELDACVARSNTRAEYEVCHCKVNVRWSRPCKENDGGQ